MSAQACDIHLDICLSVKTSLHPQQQELLLLPGWPFELALRALLFSLTRPSPAGSA